MENADLPAMPLSGDAYTDFAGYNPDRNDSSYNPECQGLTKREYFAAMAMQGMLSSRWVADFASDCLSTEMHSGIAKSSLAYADALLKELEK